MNWLPFGICLALAVLINLFPWFMAFVVKASGWRQVGWVYYLFTFPLGLALVILGFILAFVLPA